MHTPWLDSVDEYVPIRYTIIRPGIEISVSRVVCALIGTNDYPSAAGQEMITITNRQKLLSLDRRRIRQAVGAVLRDAGLNNVHVSVAVVDDRTIAELHGRYLGDSAPTDVLSFVLENGPDRFEGEVVVSAETASANAPRYGNTPEDELLLYIIHGSLHLAGYDDQTPADRAVMRKREKQYLKLAE